jgi:hypothetical protein
MIWKISCINRNSQALAYLFKVPEGAAKGVDPGFFKQMEKLKEQVFASLNDSRDTTLSEINHSNRNNMRWFGLC